MAALFGFLTSVVLSGSTAKITLPFQVSKKNLVSISENSPS